MYIKQQLIPRGFMKVAESQSAESIPALSQSECDDFVNWLLSDIAHRVPPTKRGEGILRGKHIQRQGDRHLRGSDQTELIYIALTVMIANHRSQKEACIFVANNPNVSLGTSRRGRPAKAAAPRDLTSKAQTVRAILNRFRLPGPPTRISELVHRFLWLRENRIVEGSRYAANSGQRLQEAAQRTAIRLGIDPIQLRRR